MSPSGIQSTGAKWSLLSDHRFTLKPPRLDNSDVDYILISELQSASLLSLEEENRVASKRLEDIVQQVGLLSEEMEQIHWESFINLRDGIYSRFLGRSTVRGSCDFRSH